MVAKTVAFLNSRKDVLDHQFLRKCLQKSRLHPFPAPEKDATTHEMNCYLYNTITERSNRLVMKNERKVEPAARGYAL